MTEKFQKPFFTVLFFSRFKVGKLAKIGNFCNLFSESNSQLKQFCYLTFEILMCYVKQNSPSVFIVIFFFFFGIVKILRIFAFGITALGFVLRFLTLVNCLQSRYRSVRDRLRTPGPRKPFGPGKNPFSPSLRLPRTPNSLGKRVPDSNVVNNF